MKRNSLVRFWVILGILSLFSACETPVAPATLAPPAWIWGTWSDYPAETFSYTFNADTVVYSFGGTSIDFQQINNDLAGTDWGYFDSTPNSTTYIIEYRVSGMTQKYSFVQTSPTTLDYSFGFSPNIELSKK